ncbi:MAG: AsnC family transcriptional regulator [Gemmatimonadales bacterium]|nr:AsnC family transcriptional regulator [Gemmatimonadales bacterium]NIN10107.1 AsnC family transcriptional regulator [Gemmatimonadales bacterium]NIR02591.1 AsnC family transcriptional regulator [Gemmatimonadales bacterium]NIS66285.1 AsnC family transcriptional regulator [Gemmatimonadales bacterium]
MDAVDRRIVALLQANAQLGYQELGEAVGLSSAAAYQRVRKLEAAGVVTGYHARVDAAALGRGVVAFLRVQPGPRTDLKRLIEVWTQADDVLECHRVTGGASYLLKLRLGTTQDLGPHLDAARKLGCEATAELGLGCVFEGWTLPVARR